MKKLIFTFAVLIIAAGALLADNSFIYFDAPENGKPGWFAGCLTNVKSTLNGALPELLASGFNFQFADVDKVKSEAARMGYKPDYYCAMSREEMVQLAKSCDARYIIVTKIIRNEWDRFDNGEEYVDLGVNFKIFDAQKNRYVCDTNSYYYNKKSAKYKVTGKKEYDALIKLIDALTSADDKNTFISDSLYAFVKECAVDLDGALDGTITISTTSTIKTGDYCITKCSKWEDLVAGDKCVVFGKKDNMPFKIASGTVSYTKKNEVHVNIDNITDEAAAKKKQSLYFIFTVGDPIVKTVSSYEAEQ